MTATVSDIWRYPIKSHGRERLNTVNVTAGHGLPGDRQWAVAHSKSDADGSTWVPCGNFMRVTSTPALAAIACTTHADGNTLTLSHPDLAELTFKPDDEGTQFLAWIAPLTADSPRTPARIVRAEQQVMTDADFPSITLCSHASHRAVQQKAGRDLSPHRWRGNIWIDGLAPWEEFDWVGKTVQIGDAVFKVIERTGRCKATHANPETGRRDIDLMGVLETWGHTDFSVQAEVVKGGKIADGAPVRLH